MSTRISEMAVATEMANTAILPIVAASANFSVSKELLLTGAAGENVELAASAGQQASLLCDSGNAGVVVDDGGTAALSGNNGCSLSNPVAGASVDIDAGGNIAIDVGTGSQVNIGSSVSAINLVIDTNFETLLFQGSGGCTLSYLAGFPGDWSGSPPPDMQTAIDRIARVVSVGGTVPIP